MAKYLVLIYGDEQEWDALTAEEEQEYMNVHGEFAAAARYSLFGGNELESTSAATSCATTRTARLMVTDGPFVETKEVLGGCFPAGGRGPRRGDQARVPTSRGADAGRRGGDPAGPRPGLSAGSRGPVGVSGSGRRRG